MLAGVPRCAASVPRAVRLASLGLVSVASVALVFCRRGRELFFASEKKIVFGT